MRLEMDEMKRRRGREREGRTKQSKGHTKQEYDCASRSWMREGQRVRIGAIGKNLVANLSVLIDPLPPGLTKKWQTLEIALTVHRA